MIFHQLQLGKMDNFYYIIGDEKTKEVAMFDCGWEGEKVLDFLQKNNYTLTHIFLTHIHYDHSGEADFLSKKTGAKTYVSEKINSLKKNHKQFVYPKKFTTLANNEITSVGNIQIKTLEAPGHQDDHVIFIVGKKYLITGDILFIGNIGGLHFDFSIPKKMPATLEMINKLDEHLIICSGHDYGEVKRRSLKEEKLKNKYLVKPQLAVQMQY